MDMAQSVFGALIGFGSAITVAVIAGLFQLRIEMRNREVQEKQLEESKKQFLVQMEQTHKEYIEKLNNYKNVKEKARWKKQKVSFRQKQTDSTMG